MKTLKQIKVDDRTFQYNVRFIQGHRRAFVFSSFYEGTEEVISKKYWLFGKNISKTVPKLIFNVDMNVENPENSKEVVRRAIYDALKVVNRKEEIKRGELV